MSNGTPEENLKQIFRVFDINNDGTLSPSELKRLVKDLFQMFPHWDNPDHASQNALAAKAFKEMDANSGMYILYTSSGKCHGINSKNWLKFRKSDIFF